MAVIPKRPINRDVPAPEEKPEMKAEKPPREPKSPAPKLLAALVVLALVFIVVAIVGSSGGSKDESASEVTTPAPATNSNDSGDESPSPQVAEALAFPAFATNNTTRIGGPDATSNAAGVALAVFPSTTEAQQPDAVTVVDEDDWEGAIAASVLMAPPVSAPILFSREGALPGTSAEALEALDPAGGRETGKVAVFVIGARGSIPTEGKVEHISGARPTPFEMAAAIAAVRERLAGPPSHLVIAPVGEAEYAAPAAAWAARSGDPVLYVESGRLPPETAGVLQRHPEIPVYVLGPAAAISEKVVKQIAKISKRVKRVAGKTPAANAVALARYHDGTFGWNVNDPGHGFVLTRSDSPTGAAGAAALSASGTWGPLLLTEGPDRLPSALRSYFLDVKPGYTTDPTRAFYNHVWVVGDQGAIDVSQQAKVNELAELAKIGGGE
jgi:hypothetical protein